MHNSDSSSGDSALLSLQGDGSHHCTLWSTSYHGVKVFHSTYHIHDLEIESTFATKNKRSFIMSLSPFQTFQGRASSWERSPGKQETNHEDVRSAVWLFDIDISSLLEVAVNLIMNRGSRGPLLHILGALSCAALGLSLPSFLQLALVLSHYPDFGPDSFWFVSRYRTFNQYLMYMSGCLYDLSSTLNPILYNLMSSKYRKAFRTTLLCAPQQSPKVEKLKFCFSRIVL